MSRSHEDGLFMMISGIASEGVGLGVRVGRGPTPPLGGAPDGNVLGQGSHVYVKPL